MGGWTTKGLWKADGSCGRGMQPLSELWPGRESWSISFILYSFSGASFWLNLTCSRWQDDPEIQFRGQPLLSPGSIAGRRVEMNPRRANQTSMVGDSVALDSVSVSPPNSSVL